jgi:hypothetical protein
MEIVNKLERLTEIISPSYDLLNKYEIQVFQNLNHYNKYRYQWTFKDSNKKVTNIKDDVLLSFIFLSTEPYFSQEYKLKTRTIDPRLDKVAELILFKEFTSNSSSVLVHQDSNCQSTKECRYFSDIFNYLGDSTRYILVRQQSNKKLLCCNGYPVKKQIAELNICQCGAINCEYYKEID